MEPEKTTTSFWIMNFFNSALKTLIAQAFLFLCASVARGDIFEVNDLSRFEHEVINLQQDSLIIFDIDYTLLTPKDSVLKPCGRSLRKKYLYKLDPKEREFLQSIIALTSGEELVDKRSTSLIRELQKHAIPVIALTALETGEYGMIKNLEEWRLSQLRKFSIDFSSSFQQPAPLILLEDTPCNGHFPLFQDGVLFTNHVSKGSVLAAFLEKINWKPTTIVFIDDSFEQIKCVESTANSLGIAFIGFHYTAEKNATCDLKMGEFQFQYLLENAKWLTDTEAKKMLQEVNQIKESKLHHSQLADLTQIANYFLIISLPRGSFS